MELLTTASLLTDISLWNKSDEPYIMSDMLTLLELQPTWKYMDFTFTLWFTLTCAFDTSLQLLPENYFDKQLVMNGWLSLLLK